MTNHICDACGKEIKSSFNFFLISVYTKEDHDKFENEGIIPPDIKQVCLNCNFRINKMAKQEINKIKEELCGGEK